jgi:hypothetical protein
LAAHGKPGNPALSARPRQCPAFFNVFANSPALLNAAIASFEVTATVVFMSLMLPPAAPAMASASAA